jgi:hypothetical protein
MRPAGKKKKFEDVEKVAAQLGKVQITPIAEGNFITVRAAAKFTTRSFTAGKYRVSVGLTHALLQLEYQSFEMEHAYQATLAKETWSESWTKRRASHLDGKVKVKFGTKILNLFGFFAEGEAERASKESTEQKANLPYKIVSATPSGWHIGTNLGDPRTPLGTVAEGLEHCLDGEYLSGRNGEKGDGRKDKTGALALCVLRPKAGGYDPSITATLLGASGSLQVVVKATEETPQIALNTHNKERDVEEELRKAFVEICIQRSVGARTEKMLTGEFYLDHQEKHAPKIVSNESSNKPISAEADPA